MECANLGIGTTSACAENTPSLRVGGLPMRNYLRVRGEYSKKILLTLTLLELPPRARRIRVTGMTTTTMMGTTSACAENTFWLTMFGGECWNYLRVRGEYWKPGWTHPRLPELPPRARRILTKFGSQRLSGGTTSACAENTSQSHQQSAPARNYLRVRGEYSRTLFCSMDSKELPPRARRIQ